MEVGIDWSTYGPSANLPSWFCLEVQDLCLHTANNGYKQGVAHHQPGGTAVFISKEMARYVKQKGNNFRGLGRWCSMLLYADKNYRFQFFSAYSVGRQALQGDSTIFQQQLRYIQNNRLATIPCKLFMIVYD